ncbi:MAG TPA: penicillin-binding protein 1C, partial [Serratia sp.]|nr:penicillin-binding protein 1C [Serratia sp. (in: enterobacteria)]
RRLALWPTPLEPWLPAAERRAQRLPAIDPQCPPLQQQEAPPLLMLGVRDGAILRRLPGNNALDLRVSTQGGGGQRWWFLNGQLVGEGESLLQTLTQPGRYQLSVLDESGQVAVREFSLD